MKPVKSLICSLLEASALRSHRTLARLGCSQCNQYLSLRHMRLNVVHHQKQHGLAPTKKQNKQFQLSFTCSKYKIVIDHYIFHEKSTISQDPTSRSPGCSLFSASECRFCQSAIESAERDHELILQNVAHDTWDNFRQGTGNA